ncbi:hypothetical protein GCM10020258_27200 [Sphingomonas yabuuchiae]
MTLRVVFSQMRSDPFETEKEARLQLAEASRRLKVEMMNASAEFGMAARASRQSVADAIEEMREKLGATLDEAGGRLRDAVSQSAEGLAGASKGLESQLGGAAARLSEASDALRGALDASQSRWDDGLRVSMERNTEFNTVGRRLSAAVDRLAKRMEEGVGPIDGVEQRFAALSSAAEGWRHALRARGAAGPGPRDSGRHGQETVDAGRVAAEASAALQAQAAGLERAVAAIERAEIAAEAMEAQPVRISEALGDVEEQVRSVIDRATAAMERVEAANAAPPPAEPSNDEASSFSHTFRRCTPSTNGRPLDGVRNRPLRRKGQCDIPQGSGARPHAGGARHPRHLRPASGIRGSAAGEKPRDRRPEARGAGGACCVSSRADAEGEGGRSRGCAVAGARAGGYRRAAGRGRGSRASVGAGLRRSIEGGAGRERSEETASRSGISVADRTDPDRDMERRGEDLRRRIADIAAERDALKGTLADLPSGERAVADRVLSTRLENERLKGSMAYAARRLEALGKGSEKPACWATRTGSPEYIFDVTLTSGGIVTRDRALPNRRAEQVRLPLSNMAYGRVLQGPGFQAMTKPLFDWGEAHGCRFFVMVTDRTGASEKRRYKTLLLWVEGHFYKYENRA